METQILIDRSRTVKMMIVATLSERGRLPTADAYNVFTEFS